MDKGTLKSYIFVTMLILSTVSACLLSSGEQIENNNPPVTEESRTTHPRIDIDSESQLANTASVAGWIGDGSASSPYVIEGYTIFAETGYYAIHIGNVESHVVITNNNITHEGGGYNRYGSNGGVHLYRTTNVTVADNYFNRTTRYKEGAAILIQESTTTVTDNLINMTRYGVYVERSEATIKGNTIRCNYTSIMVRGSDRLSITNNTLYGYGPDGTDQIDAIYSDGAVITDNDIFDCEGGIILESSNMSQVRENNITNVGYGVHIISSESCIVSDNEVSTVDTAIWLEASIGCTLRRNACWMSGLRLTMGYNFKNILSHSIDTTNTFHGKPIGYIKDRTGQEITGDYGQFLIVNCNGSRLVDRSISGPFGGLNVLYSRNFVIRDNEINSSVPSRIIMDYRSFWYQIEDNTLTNVSIHSPYANGTIMGNEMVEGSISVIRNGNVIDRNVITTSEMTGIGVGGYFGNVVTNNKVTVLDSGWRQWAISVGTYEDLVLRNNTMFGEGMHFDLNPRLGEHPYMDASNSVNGKPVLIHQSSVAPTIDGDYGQIIILNCTDFNIVGHHFMGIKNPIQVLGGTDFTLVKNHVQGTTGTALYLEYCQGGLIERNIIRNATHALRLSYSDDNVITKNYFIDSGMGIYMWSDKSEVSSNHFLNISTHGIGVGYTSGSEFTKNHFKDTYDHAIVMWYAVQGNSVHENYFVDGNRSAETGEVMSPQCKDNPYFENRWNTSERGNYWSDYTDIYKGATNDGTVWNIPYMLDSWSPLHVYDHKPLVNFMDTVPPIAMLGPDRSAQINEPTLLDGSASVDNVGIIDYSWTIDDGSSTWQISGISPEITFEAFGEYEVTLRVEDAVGFTDVDTMRITVEDTLPPVADAGTDLEVGMGEMVELNGSGSHDNYGISSYRWSFVYDGRTYDLTGELSSFRFDIPGTYTVSLMVTDFVGLTGTDEVIVVVRDTMPPVARAGDDVRAVPSTNLTFGGALSYDNVGIVDWRWSFEYDGELMVFNQQSFSFTFDLPGKYILELNVSDAAGNWDADELVVIIGDVTPPSAHAGPDIEVDQHEVCHLDGSGSTDNIAVVNWTWSFEDGGETVRLYGVRPTYTFAEAGEYTISLTVQDGDENEDSAAVKVTVRDITSPVPSIEGDLEIDMGQTASFDASGSSDNVGVDRWKWEFEHKGETISRSGEVLEHTFEHPGEYLIELTVYDLANNRNVTTITLRVIDTMPPVAEAQGDLTVRVDERAEFDGTNSTDNLGVNNWTWTFTFNDHVHVLYGQRVSVVLHEPGNAMVTLTVSDTTGNKDETMFVLTVEEPPGTEEPDDEGLNALFVGGIIAIVIAVVVIATALWVKGRRGQIEPPS